MSQNNRFLTRGNSPAIPSSWQYPSFSRIERKSSKRLMSGNVGDGRSDLSVYFNTWKKDQQPNDYPQFVTMSRWALIPPTFERTTSQSVQVTLTKGLKY